MQNIFQRLANTLLYGGLEKEEYESLSNAMMDENRTLLHHASVGASGLFLSLSAFAWLFTSLLQVNRISYLAAGLSTLAVLLCVTFFDKRTNLHLKPLTFIFQFILYAFAIHISMLHPNYPSVTIVVFLLMVPLIFLERPIYIICVTVIVVIATCLLVGKYKTPDIAQSDVVNTITFAVVGILSNVVIMEIRCRSLYRSGRITYLSETDLLTGTKNRNSYQTRILEFTPHYSQNLTCVFADVNGLHTVNNEKGHEAGDEMLVFIAYQLKQHFDPEHIYRIGGDEFVIFRFDRPVDETCRILDELRRINTSRHYNVSFGVADTLDRNPDVEALVSKAEKSMFAEKRKYYRQTGYDRRQNQDH